MQVLDYVFLALIALLVLRGFLKGFTGEFFSIAALALALIAAALLLRNGAAFIRARYLHMTLLPEILAFVIIFLVVFIACKIIERIVKDIIDRLNLETLDKMMGIVLGLAEGLALVVFVIVVLNVQPLFNAEPLLEKSLFSRLLQPFMGTGAFRV